MSKIAVAAFVAGMACAMGMHVQALPLPQELRTSMPGASLAGQAKMTYWGFDVYQATLWVAPGFTETALARSTFALELAYLRDLKGADIAKRSIAEMQRQAPLAKELAERWQAQMRTLFPDVQAGDRITGLHLADQGAVFWFNGVSLGEVRDPAFAKLFFGIWLSPQTSEPAMRTALLAQAKAPVSPVPAP
jgi:hypothetical protein